ncbi:Protein nud1 [Elasticomyces elasticus]|uniref:Protein nud1 n=1 Tax=Exophiala sideris TaxID=1016849 RepID=A0ABR0JIC3_9EURO|nr:Protein nud1 [Elasticomyces elasticus]KAK5034161.1 Protein nud1 [Exophiala sideris]KAK5042457.1 Protein nud1 [Exophiala sideris]KAK5065539.1 Protein nud1 [Exophiala sideris]KAK5186003.1 Protein nud1 [Eurotiomycetes sp. CCFEE 6388]
MEPWLDSLSEDWKSEHQSSSPAPSLSSSHQSGSIALSRSQSRIPHLARNMRKESGTGSFLRHRSTKGQARVNGEPILRERSASSLNVPYSLGSVKYNSLPRRPSSAFSESQNSVQHHTLDEKPDLAETPEWKRRLGNGEDIASDGFDLFSPSKLQGMFKQPNSSQLNSDNDTEAVQEAKPMRPFNLPPSNPFPMQYSSVRETKSRLNLDVLEEVEEEESEQHNLPNMPARSVRTTSVGGLVRQRVASFERARETSSAQSSPRSVNESQGKSVYNARDPRWRTLSGQEELKNEFISPVTVSKQNSIRAQVLRSSDDIDIDALDNKLRQAASGTSERPTSSSSDRDVSYGASNHANGASMDEPLPDLTSLSLPDDLSMGTQDFVSHGGFINSRRGGRSNDNSFLRKSLSLSHEPSRLESHPRNSLEFRSSPPQQSRHFDDSIDHSRITASAPVTPQDTSVVHHTDVHLRPVSSGSPLKLFGNRDTYTNNKLLRILSQFEEPEESTKPSGNDVSYEEPQDNALRMSQFGQGELDEFGFEQEIPRPAPIKTASLDATSRIFKPTSASQETVGTVIQTDKSELQLPKQAAALEKERTTKRRKTLVKEQVAISNNEVEFKVTIIEDPASLAGTKRKDARPGVEGAQADPKTLASRDLLKPRSARRQSTDRVEVAQGHDIVGDEEGLEEADQDLTEALAAELATFAQEAVHVHEESRKPSLATKDYMEEANKVMQFIRARGKPQPVLRDITEPEHASELNPDAILDLELDGDSTKDSFSRPPSRDRAFKPAPDRRHARHDSKTEDYLKKFQDQDGLEALASNSVFGTWAQVDNRLAVEAAEIPVTDDFQESDPPNIRIRNTNDTIRKRKHSASTVEGPHDPDHEGRFHTQPTQNSTQHSFPTSSSSTTGQKGVIACGTVSIPDRVGGMTFDHEKKMWVKKMQKDIGINNANDQTRDTLGEADPFEDIPDLSTDELEELHAKARQLEAEVKQTKELEAETVQKSIATSRPPLGELEPEAVLERDQQQWEAHDDAEEVNQSSLRSRVSEHEVKLHDGMASKPPAQLNENRKQARVVTIAFSSPVVSGINYARMSDEDFDALPREDDLPLDESQIDLDESSLTDDSPDIQPPEYLSGSLRKKQHKVVMEKDHVLKFQPRTISTIAEHDEDYPARQMSLIHANQPSQLTPAPPRSIVKLQKGAKGASILCLTPLSEFSVHQVDSAKHPDQSYVEERKHSNALRHAHGSMALAVDQLMKAITDAAPDELYWEELRKMTLPAGTVTSLHSLKEYCPALEELTVSQNQITQVGGLPRSLRVLDIHNNLLNDLTSWAHLQNLQYLDVSDNALESLEGFSSLVHLRSLKANNNRITNIDAILDLDGLLDLQLSGNELTTVDFEGSELSRLRSLDLRNNLLREVKSTGCLPQLKKLDVSSNRLQHFDTEFQGTDVILEELRLSHNELQVIGLKHMPMLRYLDIDGNQINNIRGLSTAYNLEVLSVREQAAGSQIVNLVLSTANECRTILLSSNSVANGTIKLPTLPQNNLRDLEIAACGMTELPEGFGTSFPNCRYLNANFNAIKDITPLRKMAHLNRLLLAKNRVKRLRRTCLVLSRLASLERIDLRDNPLTIGFYSPVSGIADSKKSLSAARYHLPEGLPKEDASWVKALDEVTGLKRRTIELLLADHCKELVELDGLTLCRKRLGSKDDTWTRLTSQGVLVKCPASVSSVVVEKPADEVGLCLNEVVLRQETSMIMDCDVFDG